MARALEVANYIIYLRNKEETVGNYYSLSNLKLQKLLYYCQGGHYKWDNEQLIDDTTFEAWQYGPVIRSIYYEFKNFGQNDIKIKASNGNFNLSDDERETIEAVWNQLKDLGAFDLVKSTHEETPWKETYENNLLVIEEKKIRDFFVGDE